MSQTDTASHNVDLDIAVNYAEVQGHVADAARDAGRDPAEVTLVAVGKTFPAERMLPVLNAGQRAFGENRVQEAEEKWPALRQQFPDLCLHLIGPLQGNKARQVAATRMNERSSRSHAIFTLQLRQQRALRAGEAAPDHH